MITNLPASLRGRVIKENVDMDELISKKAALVAVKDALMAWSYMPEWRDETILEAIAELPPAQPEIIHCEKCQFSEYDALYGDRYCHYDGKAEIVPDEHFCGYGRERQNG